MASKKKKPAKKAAKKSSKKAAKKPAKTQPRRASAKAKTILTPDQRRSRLKPPDGYEDVVQQVIEVWEANPKLRVPGLTRAQLASKLKASLRAEEKERVLRAKHDAAIRPVSDGRIIAQDEVWRRLLDLNASTKSHARVDPRIAEAFTFLTDALRRSPKTSPETEDPETEEKPEE
jgi:hypothetical protein